MTRFFTRSPGSTCRASPGVPTFMRLPHVAARIGSAFGDVVDVGLIGVPWDSGTTNRPGSAAWATAAAGMLSTMIRAENGATRVRPFEAVNCADLGDVGPNPADIMDSMARITAFYDDGRGGGDPAVDSGGRSP